MGKASQKKKARRLQRERDEGQLRVALCTFPSRATTADEQLVKAAILYADEVVLYSPVASMLGQLAAVVHGTPQELVSFFASAALAADSVDGSRLGSVAGQLSTLRDAADVALADPLASLKLAEIQGQFQATLEEQLTEVGIDRLMPALEAGLVRLDPLYDELNAGDDFADVYLERLTSVLSDRQSYPLFDSKVADLVKSAVDAGAIESSEAGRARARQAGLANAFLDRLPTFPNATLDEVIDVRADLKDPLVRFRGALVAAACDVTPEAFDSAFDEAAHEVWVAKVAPALLEIQELVEERRLVSQFASKVIGGGSMAGAVTGLFIGSLGDLPIDKPVMAVVTAMAGAGAEIVRGRDALQKEIASKPFYLLHRTEELLS